MTSAAQPAKSRKISAASTVFWAKAAFRLLNKPLPVAVISGVFLLAISAKVQDRYWRKQQELLQAQSRSEKNVQLGNEASERLLKSAGKLIAASADILGAHEQQFNLKELKSVNERYNTLQSEWDAELPLNQANLRLYFNEPDCLRHWQQTSDSLEELDKQIAKLQEFQPAEQSLAHNQQIARTREVLDRVQRNLLDFAIAMHKTSESASERNGSAIGQQRLYAIALCNAQKLSSFQWP